MKEIDKSVEAWLQAPFKESVNTDHNIWDPGFDAERKLVISHLGLYYKVFLRPAKFINRFYHRVYPLLIESWTMSSQVKLYDGFCTIDAQLDIRFQATLKYAEKNIEVLPEINRHIKSVYQGFLIDILDKELLKLTDGEWVQKGLNQVERRIENAVNENLMLKNIQCRTLCSLKPSFEDFPEDESIDGRFVQESVYLNIIKKNFEFREKKAQEEFRQEQQLEQEKLDHKKQMLEQLNKEDELVRLKQAMEAENEKRQLEDLQQQATEKFILEERLKAEEIQQKLKLLELEKEAELEEKTKLQLREQQIEQELLDARLAHQSLLKEAETEQEIKEFEDQQRKWNAAKKRLQDEKNRIDADLKQQETEAELRAQEKLQLEKQKLLEQLREEQIKHEARIKEMELAADLEEQQKKAATSQKTEDYLRREIELLVLEKQRAELSEEITKARQATEE